ncbi:hypothetical protein XA68_11661 [Ophiocordyceps unilateralis]|uniref:5'-deoxynucleotidase n=1 Tax=Ophiocordyceps unilateralis TaxID=268505 RepID=A0A2A9PGB6_OPHUN|nr:hypothetical protein XA68_11661 [Ophiocordyceps unilateralis]
MGSQPRQSGSPPSNLGYTPAAKVSEPWAVDKVLATMSRHEAPVRGSSSPLAFFHMLERLKTTKREGWRRFGILEGESISDHMYRMSMISMLAPASLSPRLNLGKCIKMCLIHDMAELLVGDITPKDGVAKPEKHRREASTMDFLTEDLLGGVEGGVAGEEIRAIWQEYEDSQTLDSKFVHDVDKMELLLQMVEYERRAEGNVELSEFTHVADLMTLPETRVWADEVLREREAFWGAASKHRVENEKTRRQQDAYYDTATKPQRLS